MKIAQFTLLRVYQLYVGSNWKLSDCVWCVGAAHHLMSSLRYGNIAAQPESSQRAKDMGTDEAQMAHQGE